MHSVHSGGVSRCATAAVARSGVTAAASTAMERWRVVVMGTLSVCDRNIVSQFAAWLMGIDPRRLGVDLKLARRSGRLPRRRPPNPTEIAPVTGFCTHAAQCAALIEPYRLRVPVLYPRVDSLPAGNPRPSPARI